MNEVEKAYAVTTNPTWYTASEVQDAWEIREILDGEARKDDEVKALAVVVAQHMIEDMEAGNNDGVFTTLDLAKKFEASTPKNKGLVDKVGRIFWAHVSNRS
jgi:hypothetical protein